MKKLLIALGLGALMMGTSALSVPASPPPTPEPVENENSGAITIHDEGIGSCYAQMRVPGFKVPLIFLGTDVHVVSNKNMTNTICKLDMPEWAAGILKKAFKTSDFGCRVWNYQVDHSVHATGQNFIWTPGNQARLECFYKTPKED